MLKIKKLNAISKCADSVLNGKYEFSDNVENEDAIMLRSFNMHEYNLNDNLLAVARAGAGTNNIPIDKCSEKGIVVFNTPGANANAVKELVICELFLGGRKIVDSVNWTSTLKGQDEISKKVEKGKSNFVGCEILGKTLGVVGLGAIGRLVCQSAYALGMKVVGYDPFFKGTLDNVTIYTDLKDLLANSDFVTVHVPLTDDTRSMFNKDSFATMKDGAVLINNSRGELVSTTDVIDAVKSGKLNRYITDFPNNDLIGVENIICVPHLGASTPEAEDNCAVMAAQELDEYITNGNIKNSVNFPALNSERQAKCRTTIVYKNFVGYTAQMSACFTSEGIDMKNIAGGVRGDIGYTVVDTDSVSTALLSKLKELNGTLKVRVLD